MPRRERPDPFGERVGRRVRQIRRERGLTMERLAHDIARGSKGHLSNLERGLVRPTAHTLKVVAEALGVLPLDLVTFPADDTRQKLVDRTRHIETRVLRRWLAESAESEGRGRKRETPPRAPRPPRRPKPF